MSGAPGHGAEPGARLSDRVRLLTRSTPWSRAAAIPVGFDTHHPQGMVKIDGVYYVSSVEVTRPPRRLPASPGSYDRDAGEGRGHLYRIGAKGELLADLELGEGSMYHPGGIDWDGRHIWVPVAEYRPDSRSIIYRVDPATMQAEEAFRHPDHVGAVVHDTDDDTLHGVSWGSRRFYRWPLDGGGRVFDSGGWPAADVTANRSHYIDYQDCAYLGGGEMLCSGLGIYQAGKDGPRLGLGGLEVVDLASHLAVHQVPVELWTESGLPMTRNPVWVEATAAGLRAHFMPEDGRSTIYVYEAHIGA